MTLVKKSEDRKETTLVTLFADVTDSSRLYATYGDEEARRIVSACLQLMSATVAECGGKLIKTIGDEIMCTFPDADAAGTASLQMQSGVREAADAGKLHSSISIRIGFHAGPVIVEKGDVFGDAVNLAARMAGFSKAHQIVTTKATVDLFGPEMRAVARFMDQSVVKGQEGEFDLYELVWDADEATMAARKSKQPPRPDSSIQMCLRLGDHEVVVDRNHPSASMGRSKECDFAVSDALISRLHAKLNYHKGKFSLQDLSTNGTYVLFESGEQSFVRRDEMLLAGNGIISLGKTADPKDPRTIRFSCRQGTQGP